ncbi:MAG TPA: class I SAM-dependent methyltransferase, partial [Solirubrobacteraceae bacterium]
MRLPARLRRLTPDGLRDQPRVRALALGAGLIPPRTMHSELDAEVLLAAARGARRVVEIGVYEGASALSLQRELDGGSELHLIDPFGTSADALPAGWGASEWATRRALARGERQRVRGERAGAVEVVWHVALSQDVARTWSSPIDLVFIDGDHSEAGCERDWLDWHRFVVPGGCVVFHDARAGQPGGRGLPGPTAVVNRHLRGGAAPD